MLRIDVYFDGNEYTFRTNDNGCYLFTGVDNNKQVSCESGFNSLRRIKREIRDRLHSEFEVMHGHEEKKPRIKYVLAPCTGVWSE